MINYAHLADLFKTLDYRWNIGGELRHPTAEDLELAIDKLAKDLYAEDSDMIEMGRLMVLRDGDRFDVYLHFGEMGTQ